MADIATVDEPEKTTRESVRQRWRDIRTPFAIVVALIVGTTFLIDLEPLGVPWDLWLATVLAAVPVVSFFGFFAATGDIRSAIAASFLTLYFMLLAHLLLAAGLRERLVSELGQSSLSTFTTMVTTVLAFYVGGEAAIKGAKVVQEQKTKQEEQRTKRAEMDARAENQK